MKKNRSTWIFLAFVAGLGAFAAWDLFNDKKIEENKTEASILIPFPADQVQSFSISAIDKKDSQKLILDKTVDGWKILSPFEDWADNVVTDEFVSVLTKQKSLSVISKVTKDLSVYGLKVPAGEISVQHQNKSTITYEVGSERTVEQDSYLKKKDSIGVIVAPPDWGTWIKKSANDFRDRRLVRGRMAAISEVEVKNPAGGLKLIRKDNNWILAGHPEVHQDQSRIREMLNQLTLTKGDEVIAEKNITPEQKLKYGFTSSQVHLQITISDKNWTADFAQNKDKSVYVITSAPYFLMRIEENIYDHLKNLKKTSFKDRTEFFNLKSEMVYAIDLQSSLKKQTLNLKDSGWMLDAADGEKLVAKEKVLAFLDSLKKAMPVDFAENEKKFKGTNQINLKDEQGTIIFRFIWDEFKKIKIDGKEKSVAVGQTSAQSDLFYIEQSEIEKLNLNEMIKK